MIEPLLLNLGKHDALSEEEKELLRSTISLDRRFEAGQDIVAIGSRPKYSTLLVDGLAARYKLLENGTRQITALHVAGDFVDLHAFLLKTMDHGIVAMSPCHVAFADHLQLKVITETAPHLTRLLWLDTIVDGAIHREWIVSMGRKSKLAHLAHLICELYVRLDVVNKVDGLSFPLPLTQLEVSDVLGLSLVHVNRMIQALRREGLVTWTNQSVTILNWKELQAVAEFDPTYLSLQNEPR